MKKVITFVEEGNKELIYEGQKLDEWHKTVKKLKLEGQKDFASNEDKSPIPFRALSSADMHFINELCPSTQAVKDYSKTLIPLEVLSLVSLATTEKYFTEIYVYYGDTNHPFMIGQTGESYSDRRYFLIGAWNFTGTFKWEDVVKKAKKSYLERRKNKMEVAMNEIQKDLDNLPNLCDKWARGEWVTESYSG